MAFIALDHHTTNVFDASGGGKELAEDGRQVQKQENAPGHQLPAPAYCP